MRGHTQVVWAEHRTEPWVVVAFRGTEFSDLRDLLTDASFPTVPFADGVVDGWGRVHGGFDEAYRTVRMLLDARLARLPRGTRIWVTGHSLGGALASLFAAEVLLRQERGLDLHLAGLVTFGSPRVGDKEFYRRVEAAAAKHQVGLFRVRNVSGRPVGYDPIVHVPFRNTFGANFGHVGASLDIDEAGYLEYGQSRARMLLPMDVVGDAIAMFKERVVQGLMDAFPGFLSRYRERIDRAIQSGDYGDLEACGPRP